MIFENGKFNTSGDWVSMTIGKKIDGSIISSADEGDGLNSNGDDFTDVNFNCSDQSRGDQNSNSLDTDEFTEIEIEKKEIVEDNHEKECLASEDSEVLTTKPPSPAVHIEKLSSVLHPDENLPKPIAPRGLLNSGVNFPSEKISTGVPSIGRFFRERSNSLSAAIAKRLNLKDKDAGKTTSSDVTEYTLSGITVTVKGKTEDHDVEDDDFIDYSQNEDVSQLKGRVTFFSRSNCRDCGAVRSLMREKGLKYAEINIDVFPMRERELIERTGSSTVPQIFFNEKLVGGLVALNSLRNSGLLDRRLKEMLACKCPDDAPAPPVYGFDDPDVEQADEMAGIVRVLRKRLPIQDRLIRMRIVKNSFMGSDLVQVLIRHLDCSRTEATEVGKELARKHFIHHVTGGNDFQDGNQIYRFLEHEPFIPKCFNFRGSTDEMEPKAATVISQRLAKIMFAILESYASEDRLHVDYASINSSEEFRRYLNLVHGLHRVDILALPPNEKLAFFLNLYNAMIIHAVVRIGHPEGILDRKALVSDFQYLVGGQSYSLSAIKNGILRSNRKASYSLVKPFTGGDKRLEVALPAVNPLIHFGLCDGTRSSPAVRFFTSQNVEAELRVATRQFFQRGGIEVDLSKRTIYLTRIIKWFNADFGSSDREILKSIVKYLDANKAGLLTHLLSDGGVVNVVYQNYDWSLNS
ncbi:hypothetical protein Ancab_026859 [Ancistrocladus abbreviatus]